MDTAEVYGPFTNADLDRENKNKKMPSHYPFFAG